MAMKPADILKHFQHAFSNIEATHEIVGMQTHKGGHTLSVRGPRGKIKPVELPHRATDDQIIKALQNRFGDGGLPADRLIAGS